MRAARTDANHTEVTLALASAGAFVQSLAMVGAGCPDLLVLHGGRTLLVEVKDGSKPESERQLTDPQRKWHKAAAARGVDVRVVTSAGDAVGLLAAGQGRSE